MLAVVYVEQSVRRIPVQYAKRMIGRRTIGGTNTYIPLKVNMAGVIPLIFASSLLTLPGLIAQFNTPTNGSTPPDWVNWINAYLVRGDHPLYIALYFFMIIGFAYFYVAVTFDPVEVADNMRSTVASSPVSVPVSPPSVTSATYSTELRCLAHFTWV